MQIKRAPKGAPFCWSSAIIVEPINIGLTVKTIDGVSEVHIISLAHDGNFYLIFCKKVYAVIIQDLLF